MDAAQKMELFGNLVYVSIAIAVVGLGLALFFFFYFDIRTVRALMTGKAKRQTIERMAEQNSRTGHLRAASGNIRDHSVPMIQHPAATTEEMNSSLPPTVDMSYRHEAETSVLTDNETSVLNAESSEEGAGETSILSRTTAQPAPMPVEPAIRFDVTENTLVIHTTEII